MSEEATRLKASVSEGIKSTRRSGQLMLVSTYSTLWIIHVQTMAWLMLTYLNGTMVHTSLLPSVACALLTHPFPCIGGWNVAAHGSIFVLSF